MSATPNKDRVLVSLVPLKITAVAMIAGPWLGVYWSYALGDEYLGRLTADRDLFLQYSLYAIVLTVLILRLKSNCIVNLASMDKSKAERHQSRLFCAASCMFIIIFCMAGRHILSGEMNRGDVNASLGLLGPVYTFIANFALPALVFCNFLLSVCLRRKRLTLTLLTYVFVFLAAFVTGYKSSVTMIFLLPLATCLWPTTSVLKKGVIGLVALATIIGSQVLLDEVPVLDSFTYNVARATSIAAYGLLGSWEMSKTERLELTPVIADSLLGSHLSSVFLEMIGGTKGQMPGNFTKLVTYEYYPDREGAEVGAVTLTLTLFGQLALLAHQYWLIWLFIFILIANAVIKLLRNEFYIGNLRTGVLMFGFCLFVLLPAINSSGILTIASLPTIGYLSLTHLLLKFLLPMKTTTPCSVH
jgi:hypothetical protein